MRILVLGVYYSNNLGDGVICECVAERLKYHFPDSIVEIRDVLERYEFKRNSENTLKQLEDRKKRQKMRRFVTKYCFWDKEYESQKIRLNLHRKYIHAVCEKEYDLVVFAGGQLFMDSYALILGEYVKCFAQKNIPVFMNACGTGPQVSGKVKNEFSETLNKDIVKWISSRDDYEKVNHQYMKKVKKTVETFDPALWVPEVYQIQKSGDSTTIGLGIMYAHSIDTKKQVDFWVELIKHFEKEQVDWKIFVNGDENDILFARYIFQQIPGLTGEFEKYMCQIPKRPNELVQVVAGLKSMISFRLHSHIIAAALSIPSIAVVWDDKLNFFFKKIGYPERSCNINETPEMILRKLHMAEKESLNMELINKQKLYADELLYQALQKEIKGKE